MQTNLKYKFDVKDYDPFGMIMSGRKWPAATGLYRFGFQNQEVDPELWDGAVSYKYRIEDPRLGRFFSVDHLSSSYPHNSPYAFSENRLIDAIEFEGLELYEIHGTLGSFKNYYNDVFGTNGLLQKLFSNSSTFQMTEQDVNNNSLDRELDADAIFEIIIATHVEGEAITIFGHSHGGNVAMMVMEKLYEYYYVELGKQVELNLVTLNTPIVVDGVALSEEANAVVDHYHIYSYNDKVAPRGGYDKTGMRFEGGIRLNLLGSVKGGERSNRKSFNNGLTPGSVLQEAPGADANIGYQDQYYLKLRGNSPKTWLTQHRGWKEKNVNEWFPSLKNEVRIGVDTIKNTSYDQA